MSTSSALSALRTEKSKHSSEIRNIETNLSNLRKEHRKHTDTMDEAVNNVIISQLQKPTLSSVVNIDSFIKTTVNTKKKDIETNQIVLDALQLDLKNITSKLYAAKDNYELLIANDPEIISLKAKLKDFEESVLSVSDDMKKELEENLKEYHDSPVFMGILKGKSYFSAIPKWLMKRLKDSYRYEERLSKYNTTKGLIDKLDDNNETAGFLTIEIEVRQNQIHKTTDIESLEKQKSSLEYKIRKEKEAIRDCNSYIDDSSRIRKEKIKECIENLFKMNSSELMLSDVGVVFNAYKNIAVAAHSIKQEINTVEKSKRNINSKISSVDDAISTLETKQRRGYEYRGDASDIVNAIAIGSAFNLSNSDFRDTNPSSPSSSYRSSSSNSSSDSPSSWSSSSSFDGGGSFSSTDSF